MTMKKTSSLFYLELYDAPGTYARSTNYEVAILEYRLGIESQLAVMIYYDPAYHEWIIS